MKNQLKWAIQAFDELISRTYVSYFEERKSLITFLFHGLFNDKRELSLNHVLPFQPITLDVFRQFIDYYLEHDYLFVSPQNILNGLQDGRNYALITFDDGYYNNHLALPILQEYRIPAVFFISSGHIVQNKCFWWDIVYREKTKSGSGIAEINEEIAGLKRKKSTDIEQYIKLRYGENALRPISDVDRPFTPSELSDFSKNEFVALGNHTQNHAILTNHTPTEIKTEIESCQNFICDITGIEPIIVSYPNGNNSSEIRSIARQCGLKLGISVVPLKNYLPINLETEDAFCLKRFMLSGVQDIDIECTKYRSDIQLLSKIRLMVRKQ